MNEWVGTECMNGKRSIVKIHVTLPPFLLHKGIKKVIFIAQYKCASSTLSVSFRMPVETQQ